MYSPASASVYSNNPFIDDPTNSSSRFPDINTLERSTTGIGYPSASTPGIGFGQSPYASNGYNPTYAGPGQPQSPLGYAPTGQAPSYIQQSQSFPGAGGSGWGQQPQPQQPQQQQYVGGFLSASSPSPYASTSGSVSPQMTGMPYQGQGYLQQQPTGAGAYGLSPYGGGYGGGYGQQYPQPQPQANVSEFDPLRQQQQQQAQMPSYTGAPNASSLAPGSGSMPSPSGGSGSGPGGQPHPREYIRTHKAELEQWDSVSWKQALNSFDALRAVWEGFREQVGQRLAQGGYYLGPAEGQRLQGLQKDATHNIDGITASSLQMQEAFTSYRQSSDLASRNRVRESLNAAITSLPEWPPQSW